MAGNVTAVPCLQEWYAVYRLKEQRILDDDCVIIPGYSGDFLAGTHLIREITKMHPITADKLKAAIQARHFWERPFCQLTAQSRLNALFEREMPLLAQKDRVFTEDEANLLYEQFDCQNRQSLFIENALRVYDFFGIAWMTPIFERSQFEAWSYVHNSLRYDRKAFFALEDAIYPEQLKEIPYADAGARLTRPVLLRKLATVFCGLRMLHPLYGYYTIGIRGLKDLANRRLRGVNMYAQDLYLEILDTYWMKREEQNNEEVL